MAQRNSVSAQSGFDFPQVSIMILHIASHYKANDFAPLSRLGARSLPLS